MMEKSAPKQRCRMKAAGSKSGRTDAQRWNFFFMAPVIYSLLNDLSGHAQQPSTDQGAFPIRGLLVHRKLNALVL